MPVPQSQDRVMRLVEMVVEEVSIVDRAANKHRFLIVKRSEGMDDTTTGTDPTETDLNASGEPDDGNGEATPPDTGDGSADGDTHSGDSDGPLSTTVAALEGLTEAVELLAAQEGKAAVPRLVELAGELLAAAETLTAAARAQNGGSAESASTTTTADADSSESAAGTANPGDSADTTRATGEAGVTPTVEPGTDGAAPPSTGSERLSTTVTAIRAALLQVNAVLAPPSPSPTAKAAPSGSSGGSSGSTPSGTLAQIAEQLAQVVRALQTLTGSVKEQQQRLARLEKRSGLPNSQPGGERAPSAGPPDGSWPMDLNQPLDRESVDKSISFHDVSA
jgi:hypothetical protein